MVSICMIFFVEKSCNFHFDLVKIVVDHSNLLSLKLVGVYFEFVNMSSSEYLVLFLIYLHNYNYVL